MSFAGLSAGWVLAGLAAIAGALFLLQRLRVRHREVPVVTTLFWHEAVEETRARVLVQRFRHPWAYLLALAIASAMWLAVAEPRRSHAGEREHVLLLDGSAGMAWGTRFDDVARALSAEVARLPRDATRVVLCADRPRTLLLPGESEVLLEERLRGVQPVACPATVAGELLRLARARHAGRAVSAVVFGDAPVRTELLALLAGKLEIRRAAVDGPPRPDNVGIAALGVSDALSGAWNRVDVLVELRGAEHSAAAISATLAGAPVDAGPVRETDDTRTRFLLRDLPARGQELAVRINAADGLALDDEACLRLPTRPLIRTLLSPTLESLRPVLAADPAVLLVTENADVAVRRALEPFGGTAPAIEFGGAADGGEAFVIQHASADDSHAVLADAFDALGLGEIDATGLAQVAGRPIVVQARAASTRGIAVWEELLTGEFNFTESRAFPLFMAGAVRWLGGDPAFPPYVAAGEALLGFADARSDGAGATLDPVGAAFVPPRAGEFKSPGGDVLVASLLGDAGSTGDLGLEALEGESAGRSWDPATWLILVAFLLLLVEWRQYRAGRMP